MLPVRNLYLFIPNKNTESCLRYGIKLSEYSTMSFTNIVNIQKKAIIAYFSPKDCPYYLNDDYDILRINLDHNNISAYVFNDINSDCNFNFKNTFTLESYTLGLFEKPRLALCSSILPEHIFKYNKILDVPLLINSSFELYALKKEEIRVQENFNNLTFDDIKKQA